MTADLSNDTDLDLDFDTDSDFDEEADYDQELEDTDEDLEEVDEQEEDEEEAPEEEPKPKAKAKAPAPKQETKAEKKARELAEDELDSEVKIKVNGKEERVKVRDLIKNNQLEKFSREKIQQAAIAEQQASELLRMMKTDFDKFAKLQGIDLDQVAEDRLARKYERAQMTPEEIELQELREEKARNEEVETQSKSELVAEIKRLADPKDLPPGFEKASKEKLEGAVKFLRDQEEETFSTVKAELAKAWTETKLPQNIFLGQMLAATMRNHEIKTGTPLQASKAAAKVKGEFTSAVREILNEMDASAIRELLGSEFFTKLRKDDLQRVTSKAAAKIGQKSRPANQSASAKPQQKPVFKNEEDWRNYVNKLARR